MRDVGAFEEEQREAGVGRVEGETAAPGAVAGLRVHQPAGSPFVPVVVADFLEIINDSDALHAKEKIVDIRPSRRWRRVERLGHDVQAALDLRVLR